MSDAPPAAARDLRSFLQLLESTGRLRRVTAAVDKDSELACIARWAMESTPHQDAYAILFDNVVGTKLYGYVDQPNITLPDGTVLKPSTAGKKAVYIPEDSWGIEGATATDIQFKRNGAGGGNDGSGAGQSPSGGVRESETDSTLSPSDGL